MNKKNILSRRIDKVIYKYIYILLFLDKKILIMKIKQIHKKALKKKRKVKKCQENRIKELEQQIYLKNQVICDRYIKHNSIIYIYI